MTMNIYPLIKPLLFTTNPDKAHQLTLSFLSRLPNALCRSLIKNRVTDPTECFGLTFANKVGLASGFDKNGIAINALFALGFGFIELGGVTPEPQAGNPKPHMLRIPRHNSLINHCGLNNHGVKQLRLQLQKPRLDGIVGVNIAANKTTPLEQAYHDYGLCLNEIYAYCDFISANISCPNVQGKNASDQLKQSLNIAEHICEQREQQKQIIGQYKPLLIKISPDTDKESLKLFCDQINPLPIDGIICGNTTISRPEPLSKQEKDFSGGLSGELLTNKACCQVESLKAVLTDSKPVIAVGGIHDLQSAKLAIKAGAQLVQIYTALIYHGPEIIKMIAKALKASTSK